MAISPLTTWVVTLSTPRGEAKLDVPTSLGAEAAKRRAVISAVAIGWGDLGEVEATDCVSLDEFVNTP